MAVCENPMSGYAYPFAAWDVRLYLDTHPDDTAALERYRALCAETREYGMGFCGGFACQTDCAEGTGGTWMWTSDPWPWEYEANIVTSCDCCESVPAVSAVRRAAEAAAAGSASCGCGSGNVGNDPVGNGTCGNGPVGNGNGSCGCGGPVPSSGFTRSAFRRF